MRSAATGPCTLVPARERLPVPVEDAEAVRVWEQAAAEAAEAAAGASADEARQPYGAGCVGPGYCFMDSPGNDLESIARSLFLAFESKLLKTLCEFFAVFFLLLLSGFLGLLFLGRRLFGFGSFFLFRLRCLCFFGTHLFLLLVVL